MSATNEIRLGVNNYGTPVSIHICSECNEEFTVCPPTTLEKWGTGCTQPHCSSYDITRDINLFWDVLQEFGQIKRMGTNE